MNIKMKLPSWREFTQVFGFIMFLAYSWSIIWLFYRMNSWVKTLFVSEIILASAYIFLNALIEGCVVVLIPIIMSLLLPAAWFRYKFVAMSTMTVCVFSAAILTTMLFVEHILIWYLLFMILAIISFLLIHRHDKLEAAINSIIERFTIFFYIYLSIGLLSGIIVIVVNAR